MGKTQSSGIIIETLKPEQVLEAAFVLSRAYLTNPVFVAVLQGQGENQRRRQEALFRIMLRQMPGQVLVAREQERIIGAMRIVEWPSCFQMSFLQGLKLLIPMLYILRRTMLRMLRFQSIWEKHDPKQPHWHLDAIGVLPERQGQRIGSQLMEHFCEYVDQLGQAAYLETDRSENVRFYECFGFSVTGEAPVYEVPTWFMWRPVKGEEH